MRGRSALFALIACSPAAIGQGFLLWQFDGVLPGEELGWSIASAGDVDGDGHHDLIAGAPQCSYLFFPCGIGYVEVFSGGTGGGLWLFQGQVPERFGYAVAGLGDVTGDGVPDLSVGAPSAAPGGNIGAGRVALFSGGDGSQIRELPGGPNDLFGWSIASIGDLNGDGAGDLLVGAPGWGIGQLVVRYAKAFSGADGSVLLTVNGPNVGERFGWSVAGIGDADGDGVPDFAVGSPDASPGGATNAGRIQAFSGSDGSVLFTVEGPGPGAAFQGAGAKLGWSVAGAGDVNGDGKGDVIAGAPFVFLPTNFWGRARVISGANGSILHTFDGETAWEYLGWSVAGVGDLDGDGYDDVLVGVPGATPGGLWTGQARILSGLDASTLFTLDGQAYGDNFGNSSAGAGDVNADGIPDVVVGAREPSGPGYAAVYSVVGLPPGVVAFGSGCAGAGGWVPRISTSGGAPQVGNSKFGVSVSRGLGGGSAHLILGTLGDPAGSNLGGCAAHLSGVVFPPFPLASLAGQAGVPGKGYRLHPVGIPAQPSLVGAVVHFQWALLDGASPNGLFTTSDALSVAIQ